MRPNSSPRHIDATVTLGDGVAVIRETNSSRPRVVGVLGVDRDDAGEPVRVYLDQLIHDPKHDSIGTWRVWGAVSSILETMPPATGGGPCASHADF
jgi:hypothetical protein